MFYFQNLTPIETAELISQSDICEHKTAKLPTQNTLPIQRQNSIDRIDSEEFEKSFDCETQNDKLRFSFLPTKNIKTTKRRRKIQKKPNMKKPNPDVW